MEEDPRLNFLKNKISSVSQQYFFLKEKKHKKKPQMGVALCKAEHFSQFPPTAIKTALQRLGQAVHLLESEVAQYSWTK